MKFKKAAAGDVLDQAKPPVLDLTRINFSSISTWLRCGRQYKFRYIESKKEPPKIALLEGSSHHAALEMNNLHKQKRGFDLKAAVLTDKFMEELRGRIKETENLNWQEESEDGLFERGTIWHKEYINKFAPAIAPDIVEEKFEKQVKLNGKDLVISGVVDLGYGKKVSDYKTTSAYGFNTKKKSIDHDLQMSFYSWATGRKQVGNICFVKKSVPEVGALQSSRDAKQILWALSVAGEVVKAIEAGIFPMTDPTSWVCQELYCGYYNICRGSHK